MLIDRDTVTLDWLSVVKFTATTFFLRQKEEMNEKTELLVKLMNEFRFFWR